MLLELSTVAERDIEAAVERYSRERDELGVAFLDRLDLLLRRIRESPLQFPEVARGRRRALMRKFPYAALFIVEDERVVLLGVVHLHRRPESWLARDPSPPGYGLDWRQVEVTQIESR